MRTKWKLIILVLAILLIAIIALIGAFKYSFEHWLRPVAEKQETIKSSLGDTFKVQYVTRDFPDQSTDITIMDSEGKKEIAYYVINGEFYKSELLAIVNSNRIRCYEFYGLLIYSINNNFMSVDIDEIENIKADEIPTFIEVAKALIATKQWKWVKACGSFLLKAGDGDMRKTLERYSEGQFTQEELDLNKNSEIKQADMQVLSKQILEQK